MKSTKQPAPTLIFKRHVKMRENSILYRTFRLANERERFGKRLYCSLYAKKRTFGNLHFQS